MGDRTSIQIKNKNVVSPILYDQWGGTWIIECAQNFIAFLKGTYPKMNGNGSTPFTRKEPSALLTMFILKYYSVEEYAISGPRLFDSTSKMRGNDNGHWIIDCEKMEVYKESD